MMVPLYNELYEGGIHTQYLSEAISVLYTNA